METSYNDLKAKNVINTLNGKCLGHPIDMIINLKAACVLGLVVAGERKLFKSCEDIFIPWNNITKIGDDVILITLPSLTESCPT
ncbi:MAG: YlmC/YmxH family sporulation protein [Clostridia bacterium]